jgi:archaeosine-15-forming tRNA-guanine transglycosylase
MVNATAATELIVVSRADSAVAVGRVITPPVASMSTA